MSDSIESQQVSWWDTHVFIAELVRHHDSLPLAGTPSWCQLADGDPRKLLSLAAFGVHHALRVETCQEAQAEASKSVAAAADWSKIARELQQRAEFRAAREVRP